MRGWTGIGTTLTVRKYALSSLHRFGAFKAAAQTGSDIVPITINGTRDVMPRGQEFELFDGDVVVQVSAIVGC